MVTMSGLTNTSPQNQASDVEPAVVNIPSSDLELVFLSQIQMADEGPCFPPDTKLSTEGASR